MDRVNLGSSFGEWTIVKLKAGVPLECDFNFTGNVRFGYYEMGSTDRSAKVVFAIGDKRQDVMTYGGMEAVCNGPGVLTVVSDKDNEFQIVPRQAAVVDQDAKANRVPQKSPTPRK